MGREKGEMENEAVGDKEGGEEKKSENRTRRVEGK